MKHYFPPWERFFYKEAFDSLGQQYFSLIKSKSSKDRQLADDLNKICIQLDGALKRDWEKFLLPKEQYEKYLTDKEKKHEDYPV